MRKRIWSKATKTTIPQAPTSSLRILVIHHRSTNRGHLHQHLQHRRQLGLWVCKDMHHHNSRLILRTIPSHTAPDIQCSIHTIRCLMQIRSASQQACISKHHSRMIHINSSRGVSKQKLGLPLRKIRRYHEAIGTVLVSEKFSRRRVPGSNSIYPLIIAEEFFDVEVNGISK